MVRASRWDWRGRWPFVALASVLCVGGSSLFLSLEWPYLHLYQTVAICLLGISLAVVLWVYRRAALNHKMIEQALREKQARLRLLVDQVPAVMWTTDDALRVTSTVGAGVPDLPTDTAELVDMNLLEYFRINNPDATPIAAQSRALKGEVLNYERQLAGRTFQCHVEPIWDQDGAIVGSVGVAVDISRRKEAEDHVYEMNQRLESALSELKRSQQQVIAQERLRALGQMASGVGHELSNALSPILGYTEALVADAELPGHMRHQLAMVLSAARDIRFVVQRLQDFYRPAPADGAIEIVDLRDLLSKIPDLTRPKWHDEALRTGRVIQVKLELQDVPPVQGHAVELREVLTNVVLNAVDAMPCGGTLTMRLRATEQYAALEVTDTGTGMTEEVRVRCFEPFFTSKGIAGTGLGLSICNSIIQRHGGTIALESELGRGTSVKIQLPFAAPAAPRPAPASGHKPPARRVLYIDDDPRLRSVVAFQLRRLGQDVEVAEGGSDGLAKFRDGCYDVVITDLGMPEIDGGEVTRAVKAMRPGIPVIILTGWDSPSVRQNTGGGIEPDCILRKPPTLERLAEALEKRLASGSATKDSD